MGIFDSILGAVGGTDIEVSPEQIADVLSYRATSEGMTPRVDAELLRELIAQPLGGIDSAVDIGSAHLYEQSRRDAFNRLAARDSLMVDAEPQRLGIELVNRYNAVKRAGML